MPVPGAAIFFGENFMNLYLYESGDLGFTFKSRGRGSSRYLTIACLLVPKNISHLPKRVVKKLYSKAGKSPKYELKATNLTPTQKIFFAKEVKKLLTKNPKIKIFTITVYKIRVQDHIRQDPNKLYNYMIGLVLPEKIKRHLNVALIPDKRSIKVKSGNSLIDYLQIKIWFDLKSKTKVQFYPSESSKVLNIQFVDYIANIVWNRYERNDNQAFSIIKSKIESTTLFFS